MKILKTLLKKQYMELFRSFFLDVRKNRLRSKTSTVFLCVLYVLLSVGLPAGFFTFLCTSICPPLVSAGMGWLYFLLTGLVAIVLGTFAGVFGSASALYRAKDNDLLLSLPVPVRTILASRLIHIYLLGVLYSGTVITPASAVYNAVSGVSLKSVTGAITFFLTISAAVLLLSCILGWAVAKISTRLKGKSFVRVFFSLLFIGLYYFYYYKAINLISDFLLNAQLYGNKIKGSFRLLYLFGQAGEGNPAASVITGASVLVLLLLVIVLLNRSFTEIATTADKTTEKKYVEKKIRKKTPFGAVLAKEFRRFTSSSVYMLNTGLSLFLVPVASVMFLIKGKEIYSVLSSLLVRFPGSSAVLFCCVLIMLSSMMDIATPSVSLEGGNIWILQSLPVSPQQVLKAKSGVQFILSTAAVIMFAGCALSVIPEKPVVKTIAVLLALVYTAFYSLFCVCIGTKMAFLHWTNEIIPIKQSGAVAITLLGDIAFSVLFGGLYFLFAYRAGAVLYLLLWTVILGGLALLLNRWLKTKGAAIFERLI